MQLSGFGTSGGQARRHSASKQRNVTVKVDIVPSLADHVFKKEL